jgi:hypothetical protein
MTQEMDHEIAYKILLTNFIDDKGMLRRKDKTYIPTEEECYAIDHLCDEWDYCYEGYGGVQ